MRIDHLILLFLSIASIANCKIIVISTSGSITTLSAAANPNVVSPGDVIQFTPGIYTSQQSAQNLRGNTTHPIVITSTGPGVIIDGSSLPNPTGKALFSLGNSAHVHVIGPFEIRNSGGYGFSFGLCTNVLVSDLTVHNVTKIGIVVSGTDITVRNNTVFDCVMENVNGTSPTGWIQCMSSWPRSSPTWALSERIIFENNIIHDGWGEGLDLTCCDGCIARGNIVYDTYSVLLYLDNTRNTLVESNYLYATDPRYDARYSVWTITGIAIAMGTETWPAYPIPVTGITMRNNLIIGTRLGIVFINQSRYISNITIMHNTIIGQNCSALDIRASPIQGMSENNRFSDNVVFLPTPLSRWVSCFPSVHANDSASWTLDHNAFIGLGTARIPKSGNTTQHGSIAYNITNDNWSTFFSSSYCGDLSQLFHSGPSPSCFIPSFNSPLIKAGSPSSGSSSDFFGCPRNHENTTIGFAELPTTFCPTNSIAFLLPADLILYALILLIPFLAR